MEYAGLLHFLVQVHWRYARTRVVESRRGSRERIGVWQANPLARDSLRGARTSRHVQRSAGSAPPRPPRTARNPAEQDMRRRLEL